MSISFLSFLFSFSFSGFANNYISIFKPNKQTKTLLEFKADVQKDVLQLRSIINKPNIEVKSEHKNFIELVKYKTAHHKNPIEI